MIAAAHGNRTRITATVHPASKPGAAAFLALPPTTISATAAKAVGMAMAAGYDGVQLDWEGLQIGSEAGFERFVAACAAALATRRQPHPALLQNSTTTWSAPRPTLSVTVYAPKLVYKDFGPYNLRTLSRLADQVFVMGYDMAPVGVAVGDAVGFAVGIGVGRAVGFQVGRAVGVGVGALLCTTPKMTLNSKKRTDDNI